MRTRFLVFGGVFFFCGIVLIVPVLWSAEAKNQAAGAEQKSTETLTLEQAEKIALESDPVIQQLRQRGEAMRLNAKAAAKLPDPRLMAGVMALPTSSYSFSEEDMTQQVIGLSQMFPSWGKRKHESLKMQSLGGAEQADAEERLLTVLQNVRNAWLEVYMNFQSVLLVRKSLVEFNQLVKITQNEYRVGRRTQVDVVTAELELTLIKDRELSMLQAQERAMAGLNRWLGFSSVPRKLDAYFPQFTMVKPLPELAKAVEKHPKILSQLGRLKAAQEGVKMARAEYFPGLSVDLIYGKRDGGRSDMLSAQIGIDIPINILSKQGSLVAASRQEVLAEENTVREAHRQLLETLESEYATWLKLGERLEQYQKRVIPQAANSAEAALRAYQSGEIDFPDVARARLMSLESAMNELNLRVQRAKAQVYLLYIAGERSL